MMLGGGAAFAASDPQAIYATEQRVLSTDNTYIAQKDLSSYTPTVVITGVTEDTDTYYVTYTFTTIDVVDYVWRDVAKEVQMVIEKDSIKGQDLGLYVAEQLNQLIDHETERLSETQIAERRKVSQKTVATVYSGLVGKLLDDTTEALPGYVPVIAEPTVSAPVTSADTPTPSAETTTTVSSTLSRSEIEQLISQRVAELLAKDNQSGAQSAPAPAPSTEPTPNPVPEPTPVTPDPETTPETGTTETPPADTTSETTAAPSAETPSDTTPAI